MTFCKPLAKWPLLLCGPMLRRVTPTSVAVFIATSKACSVRLMVGDGTLAQSPWPHSSTAQPTRQIGANLHVLVIELTGITLQQGIVYAYDVEMTPDAGGAKGLADQGDLLTGTTPLGYEAGAYPTFCLSPPIAAAHILHGSCRKPHGGGPDALTIADDLIGQSFSSGASFAADRPHLLLLTGDQIYADDVAAALLVSLRAAAADLMGYNGNLLERYDERFPNGNMELTSALMDAGEARGEWLKGTVNTKLTSDARDNHLLFLGEFYAMYLFCWSDVLWPHLFPGQSYDPQVPRLRPDEWFAKDALYPSLRDESKKNQFKELQLAYDKEYAAIGGLIRFAAGLRRVRRALANVPTMMAFDDHEVTDDWNIDQDWNKESRSDPALKRIVRNGLAAYALFQCWGNDPTRFASGNEALLLSKLSVTYSAAAALPEIISDPICADTLLDLDTAQQNNTARVLWDWVIDGPGYRVIALDTRTHRDFSDADHTGLIQPLEIVRQLKRHCPPAADNRLCFVIAPAPLIGHPLVEELAQPIKSRFAKKPILGRRDNDMEAWSANSACMANLLRTLAGFDSVIVLSGDVHYAYTNHTAYHVDGNGPQNAVHARIVQLCSSALKNTDDMTKIIQKAGYAGFATRGRGWFGTSRRIPLDQRTLPSATLNVRSSVNPWDSHELLQLLDLAAAKGIGHGKLGVAIGKGLKSGADQPVWNDVDAAALDVILRAQYWAVTTPHVPEHPMVLPDGPWFSNEVLDKVKTFFANDPDGWKYKTHYVRDQRGAAILYVYPPGGAARLIDSASDLQFALQAMAVVGMPNLGEITVEFTQQSPSRPVKVEHRLHWLLSDGRRGITVHNATLVPPVPGTPGHIVDDPVLYL